MRKGANEKPRHPPDDDDPSGMTQEEIRWALVRKIAIVLDRWRQCPARVCKRARRCASQRLECMCLPPRREITPEKAAAMRAHIYRMVRRKVAEDAIAEAANAKRPR